MQELSHSQKARHAISTFKTLADSLPLQGVYRPSGKTGGKLADALRELSPEIYGTMTNERIVELKGLEYVIDRMPRGIERATRIIFTGREDFTDTSFAELVPLRRRRISYAVSETEFCFVLTTGTSEVYDLLTHLTFLNIEAEKIARHASGRVQGVTAEWTEFCRAVEREETLKGEELQQAIWNLSIILGRTWRETRDAWDSFEHNRREHRSNNGLFQIIHGIGSRVLAERQGAKPLTVYFTPSLHAMLNHQKYATLWAGKLKSILRKSGLKERPLHIISSNTHSVRNLLYGAAALKSCGRAVADDMYQMVSELRHEEALVEQYAAGHGFLAIEDDSGSAIDAQIIDMAEVDLDRIHPSLRVDAALIEREKPVLLVIDYAFGTQAFDIMDELLQPEKKSGQFSFASISVMGKAGTLRGKKGEIMLATSHVVEGTGHSYIFSNDLHPEDFSKDIAVYEGPMLTVLGTSLQNRAVLERFSSSDWRVIGLEMEGGHYHRAINAAVIKGYIPATLKIRYAYYASDNPVKSGQTLASGPMGEEGIMPTYLISKLILEKIVNP